jgi:transcriptional regulator
MLIHPWDAATGPAEWQDWLTSTGRFGILAVNNLDPARAPLMLPTHFTLAGNELLIHLARPNPVWPHLEAAAEVRLAVTGDYAYIPTYWRAKAGGPDEGGVPTSYSAHRLGGYGVGGQQDGLAGDDLQVAQAGV